VNRDGALNVVISRGVANVPLGNGNGTFQVGSDLPYLVQNGEHFFQYTVTLGDVNNDGSLDIVTGHNRGAHVYLNHGDGTFAADRLLSWALQLPETGRSHSET